MRSLPVSEVESVVVSVTTIIGTEIDQADTLVKQLDKTNGVPMQTRLRADALRDRLRYAYEGLTGVPYGS